MPTQNRPSSWIVPSVPSLLLTPELVTKLAGECLPGMKKPRDVIDRGCVGLALRLRPRGATWSFKMVRGGEERRIRIGTPGAITLDQARAIAAAARRDVNNKIAVFDGDGWLHREFIALGLSEPLPPPPERDPETVAAWDRMTEDTPFWSWEEARAAFLAEVKRTKRPDTWNDYRAMLHVKELAPLAGRKVRRVVRSELSVIVAEMHLSRTGSSSPARRRTPSTSRPPMGPMTAVSGPPMKSWGRFGTGSPPAGVSRSPPRERDRPGIDLTPGGAGPRPAPRTPPAAGAGSDSTGGSRRTAGTSPRASERARRGRGAPAPGPGAGTRCRSRPAPPPGSARPC